MHAFWSQVTDPDDVVAAKLNGLPKHVVSTTLTDPGWHNVSVISTGVIESVQALKERPNRELQVHGSWQLARMLYNAGLVDQYRLLTFPVVIGSGKWLFDTESAPSAFPLVDSAVTSTGAIYQILQPRAFRTGEYVVEAGKKTEKPAS